MRGALALDDGRPVLGRGQHPATVDADGAPLTVLEGHEEWVLGALELMTAASCPGPTTTHCGCGPGTGRRSMSLRGIQRGALRDGAGRLSNSCPGHRGTETLRLWDTDGSPLGVLEGHSSVLLGVLPLNDGRFLSRYEGGALRLGIVRDANVRLCGSYGGSYRRVAAGRQAHPHLVNETY